MNHKRSIKIDLTYILLWSGINVFPGVLLGYNLHVSLVIISNLLDVDVIEGIHIKLGGGVTSTHAHHPRYVLEVVVVRNSDLYTWQQMKFIYCACN